AKWTEVPADAFNGAWRPHEIPDVAQAEPAPSGVETEISPRVASLLPLAALAGLVVWILASPFHTDAPPVTIGRAGAVDKARQALAERGIRLPEVWTVLSYVEGQPGEINRFVWQTAGRQIYEKLLSVYVTPPSWVNRFARFQGDVAERAEEYEAYIDGAGRVF